MNDSPAAGPGDLADCGRLAEWISRIQPLWLITARRSPVGSAAMCRISSQLPGEQTLRGCVAVQSVNLNAVLAVSVGISAARPVRPRKTGSRVRTAESAATARAGPCLCVSQKVFPRHDTSEASAPWSGTTARRFCVASMLTGCGSVPGRLTSSRRGWASTLSRIHMLPRECQVMLMPSVAASRT